MPKAQSKAAELEDCGCAGQHGIDLGGPPQLLPHPDGDTEGRAGGGEKQTPV